MSLESLHIGDMVVLPSTAERKKRKTCDLSAHNYATVSVALCGRQYVLTICAISVRTLYELRKQMYFSYIVMITREFIHPPTHVAARRDSVVLKTSLPIQKQSLLSLSLDTHKTKELTHYLLCGLCKLIAS